MIILRIDIRTIGNQQFNDFLVTSRRRPIQSSPSIRIRCIHIHTRIGRTLLAIGSTGERTNQKRSKEHADAIETAGRF